MGFSEFFQILKVTVTDIFLSCSIFLLLCTALTFIFKQNTLYFSSNYVDNTTIDYINGVTIPYGQSNWTVNDWTGYCNNHLGFCVPPFLQYNEAFVRKIVVKTMTAI